MHCTTLHYIALHHIALHGTALHYITLLHYTTTLNALHTIPTLHELHKPCIHKLQEIQTSYIYIYVMYVTRTASRQIAFNTLQCVALRCLALRCFITIHHIASHRIVLHTYMLPMYTRTSLQFIPPRPRRPSGGCSCWRAAGRFSRFFHWQLDCAQPGEAEPLATKPYEDMP